jgi:hypothetical protein
MTTSIWDNHKVYIYKCPNKNCGHTVRCGGDDYKLVCSKCKTVQNQGDGAYITYRLSMELIAQED